MDNGQLLYRSVVFFFSEGTSNWKYKTPIAFLYTRSGFSLFLLLLDTLIKRTIYYHSISIRNHANHFSTCFR